MPQYTKHETNVRQSASKTWVFLGSSFNDTLGVISWYFALALAILLDDHVFRLLKNSGGASNVHAMDLAIKLYPLWSIVAG